MSENEDEFYIVSTCGPHLCGAVAVFRSEVDAQNFVDVKNMEHAFSPTATKDANGISLAWLVGDGRYDVRPCTEFTQELSKLFEWD